jgi:signal transduction histidine kinase
VLALACKLTRASWGAITLLADDELLDHLTIGISDQSAAEFARAPWLVPLVHCIQKRATLTSLVDVIGAGVPFAEPEAQARGIPSLALRAQNDVGPACQPDVRLASRTYAVNLGCNLPPLGSFLAVPLNCPGFCRGALYLTRSSEQPPFDAQDEMTLSAIGSCLEQLGLFDDTHLLTRLRLLNRVAQVAAGSLDLERILRSALHELDRHLPLQVGAIWLVDEEGEKADGEGREFRPQEPDSQGGRPDVRLRARQASALNLSALSLVVAAVSDCYSADGDALGLHAAMRLRIDETPFATCLSEGQALCADLRRPVERNSPLAQNLAKGGATFYFAVPLRAGDRTVGVLQSICTRPSGFTTEQIQLLYVVADLLGPAVSNCRLFSHLSAAYEELRRTQSHLVQTEKMRALGELAAGVAHDFNNSLCAVLGFLELTLLEEALPAACRSYLESSRTCALDAAQTVQRVQDFARWRRNETTLDLVDPNELVRQTVELARHKWDGRTAARGAPIVVEVRTEATARVSGNRAELREVLTNLILNAVDAMPQGGSLVVRSWSTAGDVFLSVQDTGAGISEAVRRRLFEPFFTTKGEHGNGMGLSVSFGIIQRHNGAITVESEVARGSIFTVQLPATAEPVGQALEQDQTGGKVSPPASKSLRVLIVEDEESIRRFLAAGLTQMGHRPRVTADAHEALAAFAEEPFDVVLTDLGLPGVSGEEVARQVVARSPQIPVILLTGWADQVRSETKPVAGVKHILGKPVTLSTLATMLSELRQA